MKRTFTLNSIKKGLAAIMLSACWQHAAAQVSSFPWNEDFSTSDSWTLNNGDETNQWFIGSAAGNPADGLYISNDDGVSNEFDNGSYSVVQAYIDVSFPSDMPAISFSFDWKGVAEECCDYLRVWWVPDTYTPTAGTQITASASGGTQYGGNFNDMSDWQTENFVLPASYAGTTKRLVFEWKNDGSVGDDPPAAVDNINILVSSCSQPVDLTVDNVTEDGAMLGWTEPGSATEWLIEYGEAGFTFGSGTVVTTTDNPYELTGLDPSTDYSFYVRSLCTDDSSALSGPFSFSTTQIPAELPFEEDWSGDNNWTLLNGTQTNKWFVGSAAGNPANGLYISDDAGVSHTYSVASSSVVQAYRDISFPADAYESTLSFDWEGLAESCCDYLRVWIVPTTFVPTPGTRITAAASGGIQFGGDFNDESEWQTESFILPSSYAGTIQRLVFEWRNDGSVGDDPPAAVDNISIIAAPCPRPVNVTVTDVSEDEATVSWTEPGSATEWHIEYGEDGFTPGTGTFVSVDDTTYTLTDLLPNTGYDFYVWSVCSSTDSSEIVGPANIMTQQVPAEIPFSEEWDGAVNWTINNGAQTNKWYVGNATGNPANSAYISNDDGDTNAYTITSSSVVQVYRDISIPAGTTGITCSFDWKSDGEEDYDYLRVWVVPVTFTPVAGTQITASASDGTQYGDNFQEATEWTTETFSFPDSYADQVIRLVFEWRNDGSVGTQPPAAIDNIVVTGLIPCPEPTDIAVTSVTATEAVVSWAADDEASSWEINYGPAGFTAGTETIVSTTENPDTISGLIPATTYDVYVRANCPSGSVSDWVGPVTIVTDCIVPEITSVTADTLCGPGAATISATATTGASVVWLSDLEATTPAYTGETYPIESVSATTTYYAVATLSAGECLSDPEPVTVIVSPVPVVDLGSDTTVCEGVGFTLNAPVAAGYAYLWSTGATSSSVEVTEAGNYSVTVTNADNCSGSDDVNIGLLPLAKVEGFNFVPYFSDGTLTVGFEPLDPQYVESYYWDFGDGYYATDAMPVHVFGENSAYNVTLIVTNGCGSDTASLEINVDMNTGVTAVSRSTANLNLYPNPSNNKITIDNKDGLKLGDIIMYNITGAAVYRGNAGGASSFELAVGNLSSGMYSVSIQTDKGIVIRKIQVLH